MKGQAAPNAQWEPIWLTPFGNLSAVLQATSGGE